ncbi:uncharacterized protein LOC124167643 [Ischnura elegans]|uniref:uncharacterized protein LOC124167643 n=1 Tax=Ischnura elegans TaxID=197161 RepID=UPI001ED86B76|nr:uncharacterized protein LOC124167643 [Ischnura elegans]
MWKIKSADGSKIAMERRKKIVQNGFRSRMGLIVDLPKPGFGTTNDGNTARRYFANPALSAEISGISENLITRFSVILRAVSTGIRVNDKTFSAYCLKTAKIYVKLYPWFHMPPTIHKVLLHGAEIVKNATLPIGLLSEEALEARHKDIRRYREKYTRNVSRIATNYGLFHRLLLTFVVLYAMRNHPPSNCCVAATKLRLPGNRSYSANTERFTLNQMANPVVLQIVGGPRSAASSPVLQEFVAFPKTPYPVIHGIPGQIELASYLGNCFTALHHANYLSA